MKIEPRKNAAMPKYAAVLASAVLLTGCGLDNPYEQPGLEGTAPDPGVELAGDEAFFPDLTETPAQTTEPQLEGEINPYDGDGCGFSGTEPVMTAPQKPDLAGVIAVDSAPDSDDPVMLDGDVIAAPDYATDTVAERLDTVATVYQSAFAERGVTMTKSSRKVGNFGTDFYEGLKSDRAKVQVLFFDGLDNSIPLRDWLTDDDTEFFEWGCVMNVDDPDEEYTRVLMVDINTDVDPATVARNAGL